MATLKNNKLVSSTKNNVREKNSGALTLELARGCFFVGVGSANAQEPGWARAWAIRAGASETVCCASLCEQAATFRDQGCLARFSF